MTTSDQPGTRWRKSTYSNNGGDCVEVASRRRVIAVRDSKDPGGPHLDFSPGQWGAFIVGLKTGTACAG